MSNAIYANTEQLDKIAGLLQGYPKEAVRTMNSVLGRVADTVRVEAARQIPKVFGAPKNEIRSALDSKQRKVITIMGASGEGSVSVAVLGRSLTLTRFQHSPSSPEAKNGKKRKKYKAKIKIYRDKGLIPLRPILGVDGKNKPVFLMPNGAGKYLFARRTGIAKGSKGEVKVLRSLSIPQMITNERVGPVIVEKVNHTIFTRLEHELDRSFGGNLGTNLLGGK